MLNGNEGADTFAITKGDGQTITIADFTLGTNSDSLKLTGLGGTPGALQVTGGSYQTLQQALDAATNTANGATGASKAAAVTFAGSTDSTTGAGCQATGRAIELTGVTDVVSLAGQTMVAA